MVVDIFAPHKTLFSGKANMVQLPGALGKFAILDNHAPIVSTLCKGEIRIQTGDDKDITFNIASGFVKVLDNHIAICVETNL